jgi:hypothetical protein
MVHDWLNRLVACDVQGLVDMYDPKAEFKALHETWIGTAQIHAGLSFVSKWIRGINVEDVRPVQAFSGKWTFDTTVLGKLGRATVRHTWTLGSGGIEGHNLALVRQDKRARN